MLARRTAPPSKLSLVIQNRLLLPAKSTRGKKNSAVPVMRDDNETLAMLSIPLPPYPDVYILGAKNRAAASLWDLLVEHPDICKSRLKQPNFFFIDVNSSQIAAYYSKYFYQLAHRRCEGKYIDASAYLSDRRVPKRMNGSFGQVGGTRDKRFVVVLQEPVARAFTLYNQQAKHCLDGMRAHANMIAAGTGFATGKVKWDVNALCADRHCAFLDCHQKAAKYTYGAEAQSIATFREYVEGPHFSLQSDYYVHQLQTWLEFFPRPQIMVLSYERLIGDYRDVYNVIHRLESFLGVSHHFPDSVQVHEDKRKTAQMDCYTRDLLQLQYAPSMRRFLAFVRNPDFPSSPFEPFFPKFRSAACVG
mmetsp:Transcript_28786/g.65251  ORF Transcript_28786/g.65251 Transcript_28786/m.65251 type:complete len:361 (-) Transcript_28786:163-1245(-)